MWLLINVDDVTDVGNNENERYLLSDNLSIAFRPDEVMAVMALGEKVRPIKK